MNNGRSALLKGAYIVFVKALREKCPNTEIFLARIFLYLD